MFYEIIIEDDEVYEQFVKEMVSQNMEKYLSVFKKMKGQSETDNEKKYGLWEYGNAIRLVMMDEL